MKRYTLLVLLTLLTLPTLAAKVTSATVSVTPPSFEGACPKLFAFAGTITVDSPGVVKYKWIRSDGASAPEQQLAFKAPGRQVVRTTWTIGRSYEGWEAVQILSPNALVSNRATFRLTCGARACVDPSAFEIRFEIARRVTQFTGRVRITGVVKNVGTTAFSCSPGAVQASAHLYQMPAGATSGGTLRGHTDFSALAVGGTVTVSYECDWNSSSPAEGEFPPSFKLMVVYDPDILLDSNPANDDCNAGNNSRSRSGTDINAMLR